MFQDGRSKRLVLVAHCLLNQNSISDGTAVWPAAFRTLIDGFLAADVGIFQLPCPELCCLGLDRGDPQGAERPVVVENTRIRRAMESHERLDALVDYVANQVREYHRHGFTVLGIVGADRSPTCGVSTTSEGGREVPGMGVFLDRLSRTLAAEGIVLPAIGVRSESDAAAVLERLL